MRHARSNELPLHAPVSAVSVGVSPLICFAVANRVLASDGLSPAWLVTQLPHGAVITALEQHPPAPEAEAAALYTVVIGSGDCIFAAPLRAGAVARFVAATGDAARVLCARSVGSGVAVLTSHNTACVVPAESLWPTAQAHVPRWSTATGLGEALAADALRMDDAELAVFAGTYAGAVSVWRAGGTEPRARAEVVATLDAHRPGCAVFAVRALRIDTGVCVATCSDDRSATLYNSRNGLTEWTRLWRADFLRNRVFDVAIRWDVQRLALYVAVGCENGGVYGYAFPAPLSAAATARPPLLRRTQQHNGRGVWRVALTADALFSCGFDGSVHGIPFPLPRNGARGALVIVPPELKGRRHVRGVACDERGTLFACTEDLLFVLPRGAAVPWRVALPVPEGARLPTCLAAVPGAGPQVALIGMSDGALHGIAYGDTGPAGDCDTFVPVGTASKALLVCGLRLGGSVCAATVHTDGALLLSSRDAEPRHIVHDCAGTRATVLCARALDSERIAVLIGDRDGWVAIALTSVEADAKDLVWRREKIFGEPVAAIYGEVEHATAVSTVGEWQALRIDTVKGLVKPEGECALLQFPWSVSNVLAIGDAVAVTQFGTDVTVYSRRSHLSSASLESGLGDWRPIAQYQDVRAPRLLRATIPEDSTLPVCFCHCSDGATVEWYACDTDGSTQVLHGAESIGREYNAVVAVPLPAPPTFACGNENSTVTMLREEHSGASETLCGPHVSNVLAMAVLPGDAVRIVTAGGNATLVVWEWSAFYNWYVVGVTSKELSNQFQDMVNTSCVPRFLSVCAACSGESIAVGSSDGLLRVFTLKNAELTVKFEISLLEALRPITALGRVEEEPLKSFLVAGDTSGAVVVCDAAKGTVISSLLPGIHWPAQAVNAIAVNTLDSQSVEDFCLRVLAAMDSGDVVLMRAGAVDVVPLFRLRVGLTALRGVLFIETWKAVAVNEERIVVLSITDRGDLVVKSHRRTNVRGVSGLAVSQTGTLCVVGQGVELVPLLDLFNMN